MATLNFNAIPSGTLGYSFSLIPMSSKTPFSVGIGDSATLPSGEALVAFSGVSGKIYDNDENFIYSYNNQQLTIEGYVFDTYQAYNINSLPVNFDCSRQPGELNAVFLTGFSEGKFSIKVWGKTGSCEPCTS